MDPGGAAAAPPAGGSASLEKLMLSANKQKSDSSHRGRWMSKSGRKAKRRAGNAFKDAVPKSEAVLLVS